MDFGGFRGGSGLYFSRFFGACELARRNTSGCVKTTVFTMVFTHHRLVAQAKKRPKIAGGACRTQLPTKIALKTRFGTRRARFWRGLGLSWAALGRHLAGFWVLLGGSWALLNASRAPLGWSGAPLGRIWAPGATPGLDFGGSGDVPGWILEGSGVIFSCLLLRLALCYLLFFKSSHSHALHLPPLFLLPFRCGGLCAALGIFDCLPTLCKGLLSWLLLTIPP